MFITRLLCCVAWSCIIQVFLCCWPLRVFLCCSFFKALYRLLSCSKRYSTQNPHVYYTINWSSSQTGIKTQVIFCFGEKKKSYTVLSYRHPPKASPQYHQHTPYSGREVSKQMRKPLHNNRSKWVHDLYQKSL